MSVADSQPTTSRQSTGPSESDVRDRCIAYLATSLKRPVDKIDPDAKFSRLGVDSAMSVFLLAELEDWLGTELPADTLIKHSTISKLARHIVTSGTDEAAR